MAASASRSPGVRAVTAGLKAAGAWSSPPQHTHVHIRHSKQLSGPMLTVGPGAWAGFIGLVAG
ncbi:DUF397 domain-containing protein [Streptomyces sp. NPDC056178]|uniref:DUF397 domain-containing protein n=1 Tax=unclassified Streptomyces TaxID=2593676 RepID=UPI0035D96B7D